MTRISSSLICPLLTLLFASTPGFAQDSDRDGLPDATDSSPFVDYRPGFDWRHCAPMDLDPDNDTQPECKARERVARFLAKQGIHVKKIAFSVVKNGQVHFADAFEINASRKILHDPDGIHRLFRIGSTSKSMVAVAAKILEENQTLSFGDWVSDDDAGKLTTGGKRTLRHLLTHQGAFKLDSGHIYLFGYPGTLRAFWKEKDDKISPHYNSSNFGNLGGGHVYSAFNYSLAGAYIEGQAGKTLEQILQTRVWDASRMSTTTVDGKRANKAPIGGTVGVCKTSSMHLGPYINLVSPTDPYCVDNFYSSNDVYGTSSYTQQSYRLDECSEVARDPAGGVMASVVDMAQFGRELLDSYHGRGGLVSQAGIRDLWRPSHDFGCKTNCTYQQYYAVGFFVDTPYGKPITEVEHGGSRAGYQSVFVLRPEADTAVSILVNANVDIKALNRVAKNILDDFAKPLNGLFYAYGKGCPGTTPKQQVCHGINTTGQDIQGTTQRDTAYAIKVVAPSNLTIRGFELSCSGGQTVPTAVLSADTAGLPGMVLANGTMTVGSQRGWYATTFAKPVSIAKGQTIYLTWWNAANPVSASLKQGTAVPHYTRTVTGSWTAASATWTLKIHCLAAGAIPQLSGTGTPVIGSQFATRLAQAPAQTGAIVFVGASRSRWGALPLPLDLAFLGAPGCHALASGQIQVPLLTSASGTAQAPFAIPNLRTLTGDRLYMQALVLDPGANKFGLVVSNGIELRIGG